MTNAVATCEATGGWHRAPGPFRRACGGCGGLGFAMAIGVPLAFVLGIWGGEVLTADAVVRASTTVESSSGRSVVATIRRCTTNALGVD